MDEAIQLAVIICPLVIMDTVDVDTVLFDFQTAVGAREFVSELALRDDLRVAWLDREVIVRTV